MEWHPTKNGELTAERNRSWLAQKGLVERCVWAGLGGFPKQSRGKGSGCPYCAGRKVSDTNNLAHVMPEVASEWDHERNRDVSPKDLYFRTRKKFWWRCSRNPEHRWKTSVVERIKGTGCPYCFSHVSKPQIRILAELSKIFPDLKIHGNIGDLELDLFSEKHGFAIEYDGEYWHKRRRPKDLEKNRQAARYGISVFRFREGALGKLSEHDVVILGNDVTKADLDELLVGIVNEMCLDNEAAMQIKNYLRYQGILEREWLLRTTKYLPRASLKLFRNGEASRSCPAMGCVR